MKKLLLFISFILVNNCLLAQKEAYNWDFGGPYVITFNTPNGEPQILFESIMKDINPNQTSEGVSCISDSSGKFLFSSDGEYVYNYNKKNHKIILYNDGINPPYQKEMNGLWSSVQSSIIVKQPKSDSRYYIFTAGGSLGATHNKLDSGYCYSIVDLNKQNGEAEIIEINKKLSSPSTERIAAIKHAKGQDIWIITRRGNTTNYETYLLTKEGIDLNNTVVSKTDFYLENNDLYGSLKSNLKGDLIANVYGESNKIELLSFDKLSGKMKQLLIFDINKVLDSLSILLKIEGIGLYSVEFSPNNSKLYVSTSSVAHYIFQFDITNINADSIKKSIKLISEPKNSLGIFGTLQLAPNGKIYVAQAGEKVYYGKDFFYRGYLAAIDKPNLSGDSCEFRPKATNYYSTTKGFGLPNFVSGIFDFDVKIQTNDVCEGDELVLTAQANPDITVNKYTWTLPDGSQRIGKTIKIPNAKLKDAGLYKVMVDINSTIRYDSVMVEVFEKPISEIKGNRSFCKNGSTTLYAEEVDGYSYLWSTGETSSSIKAKKEGTYWLTITNQNSCKSSDTVIVTYNQDLVFDILGNNKLCSGDTIILSVDYEGSGTYYDWSTGDTNSKIIVTKGGKYIVKVRTDDGCEGIDSIIVEEFESPEVSFEKDYYELCDGDSILIKPFSINPNNTYIWSDGVNGTERIIKENLDLYLVCSSPNQCSDTAYIKVIFYDMPNSKIIASQIEACFGDSIKLSAENYEPTFDYLWNTDETIPEIIVKKSGKYKLIVSNQNKCLDSTEIDVIIHPDLDLELLSDKKILCYGDSTELYASKSYDEYQWSTGEISTKIIVKEEGIYQLIVRNEFGCSDTSTIEISKYSPKLSLDKNEINFSEFCVGESETQTINISMSGAAEYIISEIRSNDPKIIIKSKEKLLKEGETLSIELTYSPDEAEEIIDSLIIISQSPCYGETIIPIHAISKQIIKYKLPEIKCNAGDYIEIPIKSQILCPSPEMLELDYEMTISIDKAYFRADSLANGNIILDTIIGNNREIKIQSKGKFFKQESELNRIYGQSLVGREEVVPISLIEAKFINPYYKYVYENGSLLVDGCVNTLSQIQIFKPTSMIISPNPASESIQIEISSQEEGIFILKLYDLQGQLIKEMEYTKSNRNYETKEQQIRIENIATGQYILQLSSPWSKIEKSVVISK